jgi:hypothetical protein
VDTRPLGGQGDGPSKAKRWELRLEKKALRNDWPIPVGKRKAMLDRLLALVSTGDVGSRLFVTAAQTLLQAANLNSKQALVDLARERLRGDSGGVPLTELVAEAEAIAEEHIRNRDTI